MSVLVQLQYLEYELLRFVQINDWFMGRGGDVVAWTDDQEQG